MPEIIKDNLQKQQENFKSLLVKYLENKTIETEEAMDLLKKFDLEKREIISVSEEQLQNLKTQFWEEFEVQNLKSYLEELSNYYLDTKKPDTELLYDWLNNFSDFKKWIKNWVEEIDTSWSNLYIKHEWDSVIITGQNSWVLFIEKVSKEDFENFVKNYDSRESRRVLEEIWFTWWMTLGWVLAFSIRAWIWLLLWFLWIWFWAYRWFQLYKSYNLDTNKSLEVLHDFKDEKEVLKSYLFLSQIWYINWYNSGVFETIDWEKIDKKEIFLREKTFDENSIKKYQLLKWLKEKWYNPKIISEDKYEIDMHWLGDKSPLSFEWDKVKFSTNYFENGKIFEWSDVKISFEKICKINEYLELQSKIKSANLNYENLHFSNDTSKDEKKLEKLKQEILS